MDDLRVVQVIPTLLRGGLERVATTLTIGLRDRVERIVVCSSGGAAFEPLLRDAGIEILPIPRPKLTPLRQMRFPRAIPVLARAFRDEEPHVVHAHNPLAAVAVSAARALAQRPEIAVVTTYHGVGHERVRHAARMLALASDLTVGVSPRSTRALVDAGLPANRSATVFNAVQVGTQRDAADVRGEFGANDRPLLVTIGRYVEQKNQALLLEALARLRRRGLDFMALIVGAGPLEDELNGRIDALGLRDHCVLTGERSDALDLIAAGDLFVLSSAWEGLPLVVLEAMMLSRPIVSTAVDGVRDVIVPDRTGVLVPPSDPDALADALERVLGDAELRARLGEAAAEHVDRLCSPETMVDRYAAIYMSVTAQRRARNGLDGYAAPFAPPRSRPAKRRAGASPST